MSLLNKTFTTSSQVQWTETDGEVILADLNSETIFGMDEVALTVWNGVVQGKPVSEVVGLVAAEYDAPRERIQADVEKFVQQMIDKGWLHEQAPAAHA
jgi:hypothetical protein